MIDHFWQNIQGWEGGILPIYQEMVLRAKNGDHFVEVGAWKGKSAAFMAVEIANSGKSIKFDCVDTWEGDPNVLEYVEDFYIKNNSLYEHFLENMKPVEKYYTPIRLPSVEASKLYKDDSLDFVFIDAAHDYDNVNADIRAWYPKVKQGGILAGHDWLHEPVARAVKDNLQNVQVIHGCWFTQR